MKNVFYLLGITLFLISCEQDKLVMTPVDIELMNLVEEASPTGDLEYWEIVNSQTDLDKIPQDPLNPLNRDKV